jgi:signal transduction histidine kinase
MEKCGQIMAEISDIMEKKRPLLSGGFTSKDYALKQSGRDIGKATIIYYGPYFFSESEFRFLDTLNLIMAIIGAIALLGSIIAGAFLARRISRPIVKTVKITEQIADGNFGIRFEGSTKTRELAALTEAVNHMAQSLGKQENLRRQLTTDVAHELRTPLSALSTHLEMMTEGVWEATRERLQNCYEEIERITALVADLEKLSQIEDGNLRLQISETDLKEIAEAVAENFASESARKNIMLTVEGENVKTQADEGRIKQVITNLISNAIKYTPEGGEVKITTKIKSAKNPGEPAGKIAVLTVEDDGIGIDPEDLPHIFERFYRTDKSRNRKTGGAGIGLTIAKSIITAHKGTIKAESKNGAGARFVVELGVGE